MTIVVDDETSFSILRRVAKRCGGDVRVAKAVWLELSFPDEPPRRPYLADGLRAKDLAAPVPPRR